MTVREVVRQLLERHCNMDEELGILIVDRDHTGFAVHSTDIPVLWINRDGLVCIEKKKIDEVKWES